VPDTVVKELFDQYAETFDVALVSKLSYQTPEHLASLLDECSGVGRGFRSTLDLGCGTGLMAQHLRARSRILIGIDLSQGMLRKAQARGYDELVESEIVHYLVRCQASDVDLIAAADVFNYFGDLGPLFETISRVIAGGGVLLFSVESLEAVDPRSVAKYQAQPTGRFVHRVDHVSDLLRSHGFTEITSRNVVLRREENCDVIGCAFHCVKPID
jgi:predicted TPR repeat methyltransferase